MTEQVHDDIFILTDEDGNETQFEYLETVALDDNEYVILLPLDQQQDEELEVVILKVGEVAGDTQELLPVEDEGEMERVFDKFQEILDQQEEI